MTIPEKGFSAGIKIKTSQFGLATHFWSPDKSGVPGFWKVKFDTGIVMTVPEKIFETMEFELQESDPKPPKSAPRADDRKSP